MTNQPEYINKEEVLYELDKRFKDPDFWHTGEDWRSGLGLACEIVDERPTADVIEAKYGHWYISEYEYLTCSECGNSYYTGCESTAEAKSKLKDGLYNNYCAHCGAKMTGGGINE